MRLFGMQVRRGSIAVLLWTALGSGVSAQVPAAPPMETLPMMRLRRVADAYQRLAAYSDHGHLDLTYTHGGVAGTLALPVPLTFVRSESMAWDAPVTGLLANQTSVTLVNPQFTCSPFTALMASDFLGPPDPSARVFSRWTKQPPTFEQTQVFCMAGPTLLEILETLMTRADAARIILSRSRLIRLFRSEPLHDNRAWWVVEIAPLQQEPSCYVWINPVTELVGWITMPTDPVSGEDGSVGDAKLEWQSGAIETDLELVRDTLATKRRQVWSETVDKIEPRPATPPAVLPDAVRPAPAPGPITSVPGGIPTAPGKRYPGSASGVSPGLGLLVPSANDMPRASLGDPAETLPLVAVSLIFQYGSPQSAGPNYSVTRRSLLEILYCRFRPQDCPKSSPAAAPTSVPVQVPGR
jgi:hypothetical protein